MIGHGPLDDGANDVSESTDGGETIGGVLLAAGKGERFETGNKLLTDIEDVPIVRRSARSLLDSAVDSVVVVVGHDAEAVRDALDGLDVTIRYNQDYAEGQSTSVRVGVEEAQKEDWDGAVFALGDMPFIDPATIDSLLDAYATGAGTIVTPVFEGERGNPVLFGSEHFDALAAVTGDRGGRRLIEEHEDVIRIEADDPGVTRDVDYESDLERYID